MNGKVHYAADHVQRPGLQAACDAHLLSGKVVVTDDWRQVTCRRCWSVPAWNPVKFPTACHHCLAERGVPCRTHTGQAARPHRDRIVVMP